MKKRFVSMLLLFAMMLTLVGCREKEAKDGEYDIYYLNMDKTKLVTEQYDSSGATGEELIMELLGRLKSAPEDSKLRQTIPSNVEVNGISINGSYLFIDFNESYTDMTPTEEVLVRAGIVRTLMQVENCSLVAFTVNSEALKSHDGTLVGVMSADSFVENPGKQINGSIETALTLYFSSPDGTGLVKETRKVHHSSNISMEKLIMEQLIEGPKASSMLGTIPSGTTLISVSLVDGVCYVNLSESFRTQSTTVPEEITLYSIVNSLSELPGVSKVQLAINGSTEGYVRFNFELSKMYEKNTALVIE
ncbi:MAG: GerMN domain-containing protein [Agathobacter sp.]|nr:GerMN domain-containing protein [Agathobacter sp.]